MADCTVYVVRRGGEWPVDLRWGDRWISEWDPKDIRILDIKELGYLPILPISYLVTVPWLSVFIHCTSCFTILPFLSLYWCYHHSVVVAGLQQQVWYDLCVCILTHTVLQLASIVVTAYASLSASCEIVAVHWLEFFCIGTIAVLDRRFGMVRTVRKVQFSILRFSTWVRCSQRSLPTASFRHMTQESQAFCDIGTCYCLLKRPDLGSPYMLKCFQLSGQSVGYHPVSWVFLFLDPNLLYFLRAILREYRLCCWDITWLKVLMAE